MIEAGTPRVMLDHGSGEVGGVNWRRELRSGEQELPKKSTG
jgi:hypothetical protein